MCFGTNGWKCPTTSMKHARSNGKPSCPTILRQLPPLHCACVCENLRPQRSPCTCFRIFGGFSAQKWLEWSHMSAIVPQLLNFDLYNWFFWMQHKKLPVEKYIQIFSISFLFQIIYNFQCFQLFNYKKMFFSSKNLSSFNCDINSFKRWLNCCYWMQTNHC